MMYRPRAFHFRRTGFPGFDEPALCRPPIVLADQRADARGGDHMLGIRPLPRFRASTAHEAFELAFRPGQRLLHGFTLVETHAHLGQRGLRVDLLGNLRRRRRCRDRKLLVIVGIRVMEQRALWRSFLGPYLQGGKFLERRQVVTTAGFNQPLNRSRLRQMRQQALGRLLVLGEIPNASEIGKEGCKAALWPDREAVGPALLRDLRGIALGHSPCARRIHDQCALA